jgi:hypothetical protein
MTLPSVAVGQDGASVTPMPTELSKFFDLRRWIILTIPGANRPREADSSQEHEIFSP